MGGRVRRVFRTRNVDTAPVARRTSMPMALWPGWGERASTSINGANSHMKKKTDLLISEGILRWLRGGGGRGTRSNELCATRGVISARNP